MNKEAKQNRLYPHGVEIPKLYETEDISLKDTTLHYRYFLLNSSWWVAEIDEEGLAFGYVQLGGLEELSEWGYFHLDELEALTIKTEHSFEFKVEADGLFTPIVAKELFKQIGKNENGMPI